VSAEANCDNYYCANGSCGEGLGGTSLAAPTWAGFMALVNQQAVADGKSTVGFLNPIIYQIGVSTSYDKDFHDITIGDNYNSTNPELFPSVNGYDLVTGWGSPNGQNLIDALAPTGEFALSVTPTTTTLTPHICGNLSATYTIKTAPSAGFNSPITLTSTYDAGFNAPTEGEPLSGSASVAIPAPGSGTNTLTIWQTPSCWGSQTYTITATGGGITHTASVTLIIKSSL
jgi:subtilase family serine protease